MTATFTLVNVTYQMAELKAVPSLLRTLNEQTVLDEIRRSAPTSRAEIARRSGISKPTVSLALQTLLDAGLVRETGPRPDRPHYGAVYYELETEAAFVAGFDLGARFLRGAVCDLGGTVRARHDVATPPRLDGFARLRNTLVTGLPSERIVHAVVAVPAVVSDDGETLSLAGEVPALASPAVRSELEHALGLAVTLENDVNLAALGEQWRGVAHGVDDFAFLSVGTGLGAAVVLDGRLRRGRNGAAGELDAVRAERQDDVDPCAPALAAYAGTDDLRALFAAARAGDAFSRSVADEAARRIALHVVPLAATLDVPLVVLGGGIGSNGDLLLGRIRSLLAEWLAYPPRVECSSLGDAAVLTGALAAGLATALEAVFAERVARARAPRA
jgi:predicted NBD/HSP70 family sugar kinase